MLLLLTFLFRNPSAIWEWVETVQNIWKEIQKKGSGQGESRIVTPGLWENMLLIFSRCGVTFEANTIIHLSLSV